MLYGSWATYELILLAAHSLLETVGTIGTNTNDGDRAAANGQERANNGDFGNNAQKASEVVHVGCIGLSKKKNMVINGHVTWERNT